MTPCSRHTARPYTAADRDEWRRMRQALWPQPDAAAQLADMDLWLSQPDRVVLVVERDPGSPGRGLAGFAEVGTRSVVDSCETSPVGYLEGWYVDPDMRLQGVGTALVLGAEEWARARGLREFGSDAQISNVGSQRAHAALGFTETDRVVVYRKSL